MTDSLPVPVPLDPAVLEARAALSVQTAGLAHALRRLEAVRGQLPSAESGAGWSGPASTAYRSSVRDLAGRLDTAVATVHAAHRHSERALGALGGR